MQTIYLDISNKGVIPTIYAKQGDVGRKFEVVFTDSGLPYNITNGSVFSVWYNGSSGDGNYTDIVDNSAFSVNGNKVTVEMISQMLVNPGNGLLCLVLNESNGDQIGTWNIPYISEPVPGADSEPAKSYYTAFSKAVESLPYPDASLSIPGKSADAAATGAALQNKLDKYGDSLSGYLNFGTSSKGLRWAASDGSYFRLVFNNNKNQFEINKLLTSGTTRAYFNILSNGTPGFYVPLPIESGGTNAKTASEALANLGGLSMSLMWENASSTSSFAAQTISINLLDAKAAIILYRTSTSNSTHNSVLIPFKGDSVTARIPGFGADKLQYRVADITRNGIKFYSAYIINTYGSSGTAGNDYIIPFAIYALK